MTRRKKQPREATRYGELVCLQDDVLCPSDGRCPACTAAFNRRRAELLDGMLRDEKWRAMALDWALRQWLRELKKDHPDFAAARFVEAVLKNPTVDPEYLKILDETT